MSEKINPDVEKQLLQLKRLKENMSFPPGHFYSPIVNKQDVEKYADSIFEKKDPLNIDLRRTAQMELLNKLAKFYKDLPFSDEQNKDNRYYYNNGMFGYGDSIMLFCMLRHFKPKRIIEIGSGFSSSVMLDTNDLFFDRSIDFTFIEPYPERLNQLLKTTDHINLVQKNLQECDASTFSKLEAGDIFFVDSTHVSKTGSDVNSIFFKILPQLKPGVIIHIHDIFYPFEYPAKWILKKNFSWNENYILKAFLMNNMNYEILLWPNHLILEDRNWIKENMPLAVKNIGGSFWMKKVK